MWACSGCVVERKNEKKKGKDGCGLFLGALSKEETEKEGKDGCGLFLGALLKEETEKEGKDGCGLFLGALSKEETEKEGKDGCGLFLGALSKGWKRRKKKKEKGGPGQIQVRYKIDENAKETRAPLLTMIKEGSILVLNVKKAVRHTKEQKRA